MSVELLPFVWALPLTYFAVSFSIPSEEEQKRSFTLQLDGMEPESPENFDFQLTTIFDEILESEAMDTTWINDSVCCAACGVMS
eukprot:Nitzschia sp. Nitz4//scaffold255_size41878//29488//29739//NITZ4_007409-RA/size41878-processed-gene-0.65-mRNA-1//-1//CDS//3329544383//9243//frame0